MGWAEFYAELGLIVGGAAISFAIALEALNEAGNMFQGFFHSPFTKGRFSESSFFLFVNFADFFFSLGLVKIPDGQEYFVRACQGLFGDFLPVELVGVPAGDSVRIT